MIDQDNLLYLVLCPILLMLIIVRSLAMLFDASFRRRYYLNYITTSTSYNIDIPHTSHHGMTKYLTQFKIYI